jgi:hypothetical protein
MINYKIDQVDQFSIHNKEDNKEKSLKTTSFNKQKNDNSKYNLKHLNINSKFIFIFKFLI